MGVEKMGLTYEPGDLKDSFSELSGLEEYVLIPLFDTAVSRWIDHPQTDDVVTDARRLDSRTYSFVVRGKLVTVATSWTDIDWDDPDESWFKLSRLHFSGDEHLTQTLKDRIRGFVAAQNLGELVRAAGASLKQGKEYHLRSDVSHFYFASNLARQEVPQ